MVLGGQAGEDALVTLGIAAVLIQADDPAAGDVRATGRQRDRRIQSSGECDHHARTRMGEGSRRVLDRVLQLPHRLVTRWTESPFSDLARSPQEQGSSCAVEPRSRDTVRGAVPSRPRGEWEPSFRARARSSQGSSRRSQNAGRAPAPRFRCPRTRSARDSHSRAQAQERAGRPTNDTDFERAIQEQGDVVAPVALDEDPPRRSPGCAPCPTMSDARRPRHSLQRARQPWRNSVPKITPVPFSSAHEGSCRRRGGVNLKSGDVDDTSDRRDLLSDA